MVSNEHMKAIIEAYDARRKLFDQNRRGKLTRRGECEACEWIIGVALGMSIAGLSDDEVPTFVAFLASVRGADSAIDGQRKLLETSND